jgi:hypothetical protein
VRTNHNEEKYKQAKEIFVSFFYLSAATVVSALLVWGGALLLPLALLVLAPVIFFSTREEYSEYTIAERIDNLKRWKKIPQRLMLEEEVERQGLPVMISHRESTAIVYANKTARDWLGQDLVGRTVDSEENLPFKPLKVNGKPVDKNLHPALMVKNQVSAVPLKVLWATPRGDFPFTFEGKRLQLESEQDEEYCVLTLHPLSA